MVKSFKYNDSRRIPRWDAWIEIEYNLETNELEDVASRVGMRGLK